MYMHEQKCGTLRHDVIVNEKCLIPEFNNCTTSVLHRDTMSIEVDTDDDMEDRKAIEKCKNSGGMSLNDVKFNTSSSNSIDSQRLTTSIDKSLIGEDATPVSYPYQSPAKEIESIQPLPSQSRPDDQTMNNPLCTNYLSHPSKKQLHLANLDKLNDGNEEGKDKNKRIITLNERKIGHQDHEIITSKLEKTLSETNDVRILMKDRGSGKSFESPIAQKVGHAMKIKDNVRSKRFVSNVPIQQPAFEFESEDLNYGKEKNSSNFDLVKNNEQNKFVDTIHRNEEKPEFYDEYTSSTSSEMLSESQENNKQRQYTSSTISNDQVQKNHSTTIETVPDNKSEKHTYSDIPSTKMANFRRKEDKSNSLESENRQLTNKQGYMDTEIFRKSILNPTYKQTHYTPDSLDLFDCNKSYGLDQLCPSLDYEYDNNSTESSSNIKDPITNRNDDAVVLVKNTMKPCTFLSSLELPFTSVYIDPESQGTSSPLDFSCFRHPQLLKTNPNFMSTKLSSYYSPVSSKRKSTNTSRNNSFAQSRLKHNKSLLNENEHFDENITHNWPTENPSNLTSQRLSNTDGNIVHTSTKHDHRLGVKYHNSPSVYDMHINSGTITKNENTELQHEFVTRNRIGRFPRIQLEDIQEVKSQDEKSSYTDTRNSFNC